jgi:hypothetical protein
MPSKNTTFITTSQQGDVSDSTFASVGSSSSVQTSNSLQSYTPSLPEYIPNIEVLQELACKDQIARHSVTSSLSEYFG